MASTVLLRQLGGREGAAALAEALELLIFVRAEVEVSLPDRSGREYAMVSPTSLSG
jgi:hypothetical protein